MAGDDGQSVEVHLGVIRPVYRGQGDSTSIREPIPHLTLSNANRLAALGLLETLADEVAGDGITVNTVATGMFATDRLADPDRIQDFMHTSTNL